jgi:hypothetical protein
LSCAGEFNLIAFSPKEEIMRHWVLIVALGGLLLPGCSGESSTTASPSSGEPAAGSHPGLISTDGPEAAGEAFDDSGGTLALDAIVVFAPAGWQRKQPSSSFVAAEFALPGDGGEDTNARLTVSAAGGSVEANVERWKSQFDPLTEEKPLETVDVDGISVTIVDLAGDFNDARGPFAPPVTRSDYRMIAAIIPVEGQLHFVKATGPQKTMAAHADAIDEFIRSVRPAQ